METTIQQKSTYELDANKFLEENNISFIAKFEEYAKHFSEDKEFRDIYTLTLKKENKELSIRFGQSISNSRASDSEINKIKNSSRDSFEASKKLVERKNKIKIPTSYDLLACITKYSPGSFAEFCSEYGYDENSRKAEKIYLSVVEEWFKVERFFTDSELEQIREIN